VKIRLYLDEDVMDDDLVRALRDKDIDVLTALEAGTQSWEDDQQLQYAAEQGRVLYSCNKEDYCRISAAILSQGESHVGIIIGVMGRYSVGEQMRRLKNIVDTFSIEELANQVIYLSAWG
jgi:hypothetical protein